MTTRAPRPLTLAALLAGVAGVLFAVLWLVDYHWLSAHELPRGGRGPLQLLLALEPQMVAGAVANVSQVIVAVLGIAITVVSIVVQLAATRYTSRIADMFFRDRTNLALMGFFVVTCIHAVWVTVAVSGSYVPRATVAMTLLIVTGSLLLLIPYFAYVFDFLDPQKVILRIGVQILDAALGRRQRGAEDLIARQVAATASIEHLTDVAVNAVAQKDKVIATHAVGSLRGVMEKYLEAKPSLPAGWFVLGERIREDPDFIALTADSMAALEAERTWLEWKVLRQFRTAFAESLKHLPEMAHVVAIETRQVGETALAAGDRAVTAVTVKFFNTYLRTALNARDIRASYNVLHQYRQLAERLMDEGQDDQTLEIGRYLVYYGQTAHALDLGFVTETAAHDLSALCERAFERNAPCHQALLHLFLDVDKEAETHAEERTLRGVRKAQVKLATYYLVRGGPAHARVIFNDMQHERERRLASIRAELEAISTREFWEVTERGINFDWLDAARRQKLDEFFGWFQVGQNVRPE
jgi:hypothetical protein